jgi:hypothetical protein
MKFTGKKDLRSLAMVTLATSIFAYVMSCGNKDGSALDPTTTDGSTTGGSTTGGSGGTYTVTPSGDANLTISPSTAQTVTSGATQAFTVTAASGYTTRSTVGGTCAAGSWSGTTYTTGAISSANCTVTFQADYSTELNSSWTPAWSSVAAYWKFNESVGATTSADAVSSNTGSIVATVTAGSAGKGKMNTSYTLNGTTGRVEVPWPMTPDIASAIQTGTVTFCAWIYPQATGSERGIMGVGDSGGGNGAGLNLAILSNTRIVFWYSGGTMNESTATVSANTWYHVCGVKESFSSLKLYINGSLDAGGSGSSGAVTSSTIAAVNGKFVVGNQGQADNARGFNGKIDEAAVWTTALTAAQVLAIYNQQN